jgi:thymidylate kinase
VEFSGTPKAGKSTIINSLRLFLARNDFKPFVLTERASTSPIRDKTHPFFNVWTACATLTQMIDAAQAGKDDVVIMDRGLLDALAWMRWLEDNGRLESEQRLVIERFFTMPLWANLVDLVLIMKVSPEESLEREFKDQVTRKPGKIMNSETIRQFNDALSSIEDSQTYFSNVLSVNTTGIDAEETAYQVVSMTLSALDNLVRRS